jgi:hypothetical protein
VQIFGISRAFIKVDYISHQPRFLDPSGQRAEAIVTVKQKRFDGWEHSEKIYILS